MWIKIAHLNDESPFQTEFDCIALDSNYIHSPIDQEGYRQLIFTQINKVVFTLEDFETRNYYVPAKDLLLVKEIDKPSLIPNLNSTLSKQFKRQFGNKFRPLKQWKAKQSDNKEFFIADVENVKELFYEDILAELARDVMAYIKGENYRSVKEENDTITLLLDDGKVKEKYIVEFNYRYDEDIDKITNINIIKVAKSTYNYPVDFNETDLYNLQKTIDQYKV